MSHHPLFGLSDRARHPSHGMGGLTLIEAVVVLAITGLVMAILAPHALTYLDDDRKEETRAELLAMRSAITNYYLDTHQLPTEIGDLLVDPEVSGWSGPYMTIAFNDLALRELHPEGDPIFDAWIHPYDLAALGSYRVRVRSLGANGLNDAGAGDDLDLIVDVTMALRDQTVAELEVINVAIADYNDVYLDISPLPVPWSATRARLEETGFLPVDSGYDVDGWGRAYAVAGPPVVRAETLGPPE